MGEERKEGRWRRRKDYGKKGGREGRRLIKREEERGEVRHKDKI